MPTNIIADQSVNVNQMLDGSYLHGQQAGGSPYIKELFNTIIAGVNALASEDNTINGATEIGVQTTAFNNFVKANNSLAAALTGIDNAIGNAGANAGGASIISVLQDQIQIEKNTRQSAYTSDRKNCIVESFILGSSGRLDPDANITVNIGNASATLNSNQAEAYLYDALFPTTLKSGATLYYAFAQTTASIFDVATGSTNTQTNLTSTIDRHTEFATNQWVWFVPMRRLLANNSATKWIQSGEGIRAQLTGNGSGATTITINHTSLGITLPAYDVANFKYVCFVEQLSAAWKHESTPSTVAGAYTIGTPNLYTAIVPQFVTVSGDAGVGGPIFTDLQSTYTTDFATLANSSRTVTGVNNYTYYSNATSFCTAGSGFVNGSGLELYCSNGNNGLGTVFASVYRSQENYTTTSLPISLTGQVIQSSPGGSYAGYTGIAVGTNITTTEPIDGICVRFDSQSSVIRVYNNSVQLASQSFTFTAATSYFYKIQIYASSVYVKCWTGATEPANWSLTYVSTSAFVTPGNKLVFFAVANSASNAAGVIVFYSTLTISRLSTPQVLYGTVSGITAAVGDRFTMAQGLTQNTNYNNHPTLEWYIWKL